MSVASPRITVIVTSFNQADLISQALDSVACQTESNFQLIVTDDGSTDQSRTTIEAWLAWRQVPGVVVAAERNIGLPAMLNRAMPLIDGEYVVVLNGDDWMEPDRLELQASVLDAEPEQVGLVYSALRVVDEHGVPTGEIFPPPGQEWPQGGVLLNLIRGTLTGVGSTMFRRKVLDEVGPWDEQLVADDFDFLLRVASAGYEFRYLPAVVLNYRKLSTSLTRSRAGALTEGRIVALKKLLGRDSATDEILLTRIRDLAIALHSMGHDRIVARRHLRFALRHSPSRAVLRAAVENQLGLSSGALSPRRLSAALTRRTSLR